MCRNDKSFRRESEGEGESGEDGASPDGAGVGSADRSRRREPVGGNAQHLTFNFQVVANGRVSDARDVWRRNGPQIRRNCADEARSRRREPVAGACSCS